MFIKLLKKYYLGIRISKNASTVNRPKSNILESGTKTLVHILRPLFQKKILLLTR